MYMDSKVPDPEERVVDGVGDRQLSVDLFTPRSIYM